MCWESAIPVSSSRAKPSIFLAHRYSVVCVTAEKGKTFAKGARKSRVQGRFLAVLEMTVWGGMGLFHVAYNGYVWKTPFTQRHPERSPRSFSLAVRRRVSDSREWETPYRRKGGTVLPVNGLAKESWKRGTKKISRCLKWGGYPLKSTKIWNCTPFLFTRAIK